MPFSSVPQRKTDLGAQEDLRTMERVKAGDSEAFNALVKKYERTVLNLVYRFTGDREQAEDLAQEVFLRIYRASGRFEAKAKFFTYLYKVTLNLCKNARDKARRRSGSVSLDSGGTEDDPVQRDLPDPQGSADEHLGRSELARVIQEAIMSLPEEQREVVMLQRYQDLSYEEISEITGVSVPAIKSRLHRAKLSLQKKLAPYLEGGL